MIGPGSSRGGRGCLASLEIEGGGVWAIDWTKEEDGNWLGAVAGMCESQPLERRFCVAANALLFFLNPFTLAPALMLNRYSGLHVLSFSSSAVGGNSSAVLQLLDSSHIHGDGALVRA